MYLMTDDDAEGGKDSDVDDGDGDDDDNNYNDRISFHCHYCCWLLFTLTFFPTIV